MLNFSAILLAHSVDYERDFNVMNAEKTNPRNRIYITNVNNVISVCVDGPNRQQYYNFETAFDVCASMKSQTILEK